MGVAIGINLPASFGTAPADRPRLARAVEGLGFESVWVADVQSGTGMPELEAVTSLAAIAGATERIQLGFGVLALPTRPLPWLATQIATLQLLSGDRLFLGVGTGGFPDSPFWHALGIPGRNRGRRTDDMLALLPDLVAGRAATVDGVDLTLAPGAAMPPVLVGGNTDAAARRAARHDGWFPSLMSPERLAERTATVPITIGGHLFFDDGPERAAFVASLVDGYRMPPDEAERVPMPGGSPQRIAEHFAAYAAAGAVRIVTGPDTSDQGEWLRQVEVIAEATRILGQTVEIA
jgi:alkanesulfonate monooxygenase SsuD/methylene tetrahydromethanopterin reductase-like flavin-dependent oxidoreductase (luciferase family)